MFHLSSLYPLLLDFTPDPTWEPTHGIADAYEGAGRRHDFLKMRETRYARRRELFFPFDLTANRRKMNRVPTEKEKNSSSSLPLPSSSFRIAIQVLITISGPCTLIQHPRSPMLLPSPPARLLRPPPRGRLPPPPRQPRPPQQQQQQRRETSCSPGQRRPAAPGRTARTGSASRPRRRGF